MFQMLKRYTVVNVVFWFVCKLQCGDPASTEVETLNVTLGSDVSLRCEGSSVPESSTLQWDRQGAPTTNTTLLYNNTAFLLLHNVNHDSQGTYVCKRKDRPVHKYLNVSRKTYRTNHILYRAASNNSEVSLICTSKYNYSIVEWKKFSSQMSTDIVRAEKYKNTTFKNNERFSVPIYDGFSFPLHIKPILFEDSWTYSCFVKSDPDAFTTIRLITLRVSAVPPGGVFRNQSVALTCEVSEVTDQVTLAWLIMKGGMGVLIKQDVLTKEGNRTLSVTVNNVSEEQVLWQCAVFTENKLTALVPITVHYLSALPQGGRRLLNEVIMVSSGILGVFLLVTAMAFYWYRSTTAGKVEQDVTYSTVSVIGHHHVTGGMPVSAGRGRHSTQSDPYYDNPSEIHGGKDNIIYSVLPT